ncbi:MAG: DUF2339 domain-containing protein, partial [Acidobacteria bacterium]|nr:DUF2339 domain-containing protein [Acidobacteriota bacterium]
LLAYGLAGGSGGLYVGLMERWWETRFLSFAGGWTLLGVASERIEEPWLILAGAVALAAPVWWHALRARDLWPLRQTQGAAGRRWRGEAVYFLVTPILLGWAVHQLAPSHFREDQGLVPLIVAVPYLLAGYLGHRPPFALVGTTAAAIAALSQWVGVEAVGALLVMALLWASLDHWRGRADGRWYSLLALALALQRLLVSDTFSRAPSGPAFRDAWALALWASIAVLCALAAGLWKRDQPPMKAGTVVTLLWIAAGALMLFGVTGELTRFFDQRPVPASSAELASGLSVSAWWLLFATGLVGFGFRRDLKSLRWAGIAVAGLAVVKVFAVDLSSLDALYRVASVAILGLVSLSIAYLYHRKGKEVRRET